MKALDLFNHRQIALVRHALKHPGHRYTIASHRRSHNVVYQTARSDLLDLAKRKVRHHITTPVVAAYGFFILVPTGFGLLLHSGGVLAPGPTEYVLLAGTLVLITIGYGAITAAMRIGEISATTPLRYSRIVFAMIIGLVLFGEKMDAIALIGTTIVIISGLFTIYREHRVRLRA